MKKTYFTFLALILVLSLSSTHSYAQDKPPAITDQMVHDFYKRSVDTMYGSYENYAAYLNSSMADQFQSQVNITTQISGYPPMSQTRTISKSELLNEAYQTHQSMRGVKMTNTVMEILRDPDGRKVAVKDYTAADGIKIPSPAGSAQATMNGGGTCHDLLELNASGTLQIIKSFCNLTYTIQMPQ